MPPTAPMTFDSVSVPATMPAAYPAWDSLKISPW